MLKEQKTYNKIHLNSSQRLAVSRSLSPGLRVGGLRHQGAHGRAAGQGNVLDQRHVLTAGSWFWNQMLELFFWPKMLFTNKKKVLNLMNVDFVLKFWFCSTHNDVKECVENVASIAVCLSPSPHTTHDLFWCISTQLLKVAIIVALVDSLAYYEMRCLLVAFPHYLPPSMSCAMFVPVSDRCLNILGPWLCNDPGKAFDSHVLSSSLRTGWWHRRVVHHHPILT